MDDQWETWDVVAAKMAKAEVSGTGIVLSASELSIIVHRIGTLATSLQKLAATSEQWYASIDTDMPSQGGERSRMITQEQLRISEEAARKTPVDPSGIWVNTTHDGRVMGNVYSSEAWAKHYGDPHGAKSVRYVPETSWKDERAAKRAAINMLADLVEVGRWLAQTQPAAHARTQQEADAWAKFYDMLNKAPVSFQADLDAAVKRAQESSGGAEPNGDG